MVKREARRSDRKLTTSELEEIRRVRAKIEEEAPEIIAKGRALKRARQAIVAQLQEAFAMLRKEREAKGMSLAELRDLTGIDRSALSRLENSPEANPTITTLNRVADALGKRIVIQLVEKDAVK
jgi:DNA-binding phage protein